MHYEDLGLKEILDHDHPGENLLAENKRHTDTIRAIVERLVSAGATRDGTVLEQLNTVLDKHGRTSKALADALETVKGYLPDFEDGPVGTCEAEIEAALRLVGR